MRSVDKIADSVLGLAVASVEHAGKDQKVGELFEKDWRHVALRAIGTI